MVNLWHVKHFSSDTDDIYYISWTESNWLNKKIPKKKYEIGVNKYVGLHMCLKKLWINAHIIDTIIIIMLILFNFNVTSILIINFRA